MHHSPYVISEQQYCGRAAHSMSTLYIATPLHLGGSLGLIEQWGLSISDTAPPEHSFIISHVQSVIRPRGGPWMVDFELLSVYCSPASHCEALHCSHPQPPHFLQLWQDCNYDCMNPLCGECVCASVCEMVWAVSRGTTQTCSAAVLGTSRGRGPDEGVQNPTLLLFCRDDWPTAARAEADTYSGTVYSTVLSKTYWI